MTAPLCNHDAPVNDCRICGIALRNIDYFRAWFPGIRPPETLRPRPPRVSIGDLAAQRRH